MGFLEFMGLGVYGLGGLWFKRLGTSKPEAQSPGTWGAGRRGSEAATRAQRGQARRAWVSSNVNVEGFGGSGLEVHRFWPKMSVSVKRQAAALGGTTPKRNSVSFGSISIWGVASMCSRRLCLEETRLVQNRDQDAVGM